MENLGKQNEKPQQQENIRLSKVIEYNDFIKALIKSFEMKEKVSENFERKIEQGWKNVALYIFAKWSEFKLVKDWKETFIPLSDDSVIGETTLLQYLG